MEKYISLSEETAKKISDMIFKEELFLPGSKLPNEKQLTVLLGVSRTSIREAVKILVANNILLIKRGVGTFVVENLSETYDPFSIFCSNGKIQDVLDCLEIRLCLEPAMVLDIFDNATPEEVQAICDMEKKCKALVEAGKPYEDADLQFHLLLSAASHNIIYDKLVELLHSAIIIMQHSAKEEKIKKLFNDNAIMWHKKMADGIVAKDLLGTKLACETHIYNAITIVKKLEKQREGGN